MFVTLCFDPKRITLARECRSMTQAALATRISVSSQQLSQWETGAVKPSVDNFVKIVNELETPPGFFFVHSGANGASE